ncbi:P-loop containing nucleoside triphosphate hydrolase protein [Penicillium atrosanguineum]|nr:P-loop containing nucleoside triphosphate hydrolase protein [Penicillium atrosanguineum]
MSSITSQQDEARPEALNPLAPVIYGLLVSVFNGFENGTVEASELRSKVATFSLYYVYLSIALFVFTYVATVGFYYSGDRIAEPSGQHISLPSCGRTWHSLIPRPRRDQESDHVGHGDRAVGGYE